MGTRACGTMQIVATHIARPPSIQSLLEVEETQLIHIQPCFLCSVVMQLDDKRLASVPTSKQRSRFGRTASHIVMTPREYFAVASRSVSPLMLLFRYFRAAS
jgi:hypothetical protein